MSTNSIKLGWLLALVACGAFLVWSGLHLRYYTRTGPGPGFLPIWVGGLLVMATLGEAWRTLSVEGPRPAFLPTRDAGLRVALLAGALIAAWLLLGVFGFKATIFFFALIAPQILGRQPFLLTLVVALILSFGVAYTFERWLGVRLPDAQIAALAALGL